MECQSRLSIQTTNLLFKTPVFLIAVVFSYREVRIIDGLANERQPSSFLGWQRCLNTPYATNAQHGLARDKTRATEVIDLYYRLV